MHRRVIGIHTSAYASLISITELNRLTELLMQKSLGQFVYTIAWSETLDDVFRACDSETPWTSLLTDVSLEITAEKLTSVS